ncbi:Glucose-6-phosphate dehydrogenase, putative [Bodo saltans]|uniref:Glucose-6-phosphate 1-dehydrogenase n=2 Tax=Bodo saltans TaxID=75058 RepID=A0A0S4JKV9_BODSA|nr:Glucose-6-phosphate dehydrogenase, putative [Bodo saltans]|eukprot:CUG91016.1 Glucose-6-phosphate dehydrogenase, putative [Bodo saltans]
MSTSKVSSALGTKITTTTTTITPRTKPTTNVRNEGVVPAVATTQAVATETSTTTDAGTFSQSLPSARPANVVNFLKKEHHQKETLSAATKPADAAAASTTTDAADGGVVNTLAPSPPRFSRELGERPLSIIVLGATGDLAKKKTIPALFKLHSEGLIPSTVNIVGYARSEVTDEAEFRNKFVPFFPAASKRNDADAVAKFLSRISYVQGSYDGLDDFSRLHEVLQKFEAADGAKGNRLFYLALPPTAFVGACTGISKKAMTPSDNYGWVRVIIEKPFGHDLDSSNALSAQLSQLLKEPQIFRIDHYLGKEMVQNIVTLRFANRAFGALWNANNIANVQITFKETIGTEGRGGYFDSFGIVRDVLQNHLTQMLALVAMEKPRSLSAEDIRDEKVAVLRCVEPIELSDCVLGQYTANDKMPGYLDDPTVPKGSKCPTFAMMKLRINNDRWRGVPFIIKAGKALESKSVRIRIQFHEEVRPFLQHTQRNELVICAQPNEGIYLKITTKVPGLGKESIDTHQTELDLTYRNRYSDVSLPDAYESLISEAVNGNSTNFVRDDELAAAWSIFTPVLHAIDEGKVTPLQYVAGTRGPSEADEFLAKCGYRRTEGYEGKPQN